MNNCIKFFKDVDQKPTVRIYKHGEIHTIKNKDSISELLKVCKKYGYNITNECTINDYALPIIIEFEKIHNEKKVVHNINIVGNIKDNMKVNRKRKTGKLVVAAAVIATLATGIGIANSKKSSNDPIKQEIEYYSGDFDLANEVDIKDSYIASDETVIPNTATTETVNEEIKEEIKEEEKDSLDEMFKQEDFYYTCDREVYNECIENVKRYDDIFEKYSNDYGVDKNLQEAKAAAETGGDHYGNLDGGPAYGIMQIENVLVSDEKYVEAYNFRTQEIDRVYLTEENVKDLETNIKIGCMFSQGAFKRNNYNILLGLQEYNMGCGNMDEILSTCSQIEDIPKDDLINNKNNAWLNYRSFLGVGDPEYVEHCLRYIPEGYTVKIKRVDNGEYETLTPHNEYIREKEL